MSSQTASIVGGGFAGLAAGYELSRAGWPLAIATPEPGMYKQMAALKAHIDPSDQVQLAGDCFTCTGQNSVIFYGQAAARAIRAQQASVAA